MASLVAAAALAASQCSPEMCVGAPPDSCQVASQGWVSKPLYPGVASLTNLYFRNAAPHAAEILHVAHDGSEVSQGIAGSGVRRSVGALYGDVYRVRAVRPGHKGDRRLMMEHRVGAVELKDCECPQPEFVDCSKPPFTGPRWTVPDPVVFDNRAGAAVDLFFWNGTCEELVNWDDVGGMQHASKKYIMSTQGHTFRVRSSHSATRRMLMQHTLNDLVLRGCPDDDQLEVAGSLEQLEIATLSLLAQRDELRTELSAEVASLIHLLQRARGNVTVDDTVDTAAAATFGAAPGGVLVSMKA